MKVTVNPRQAVLDQIPRNAIGAEIGVHKGDFSDSLLRWTRPRKLHLIDPWIFFPDDLHKKSYYGGKHVTQEMMDERYQGVANRFRSQVTEGSVAIHRATGVDAATEFADGYFDWVYVDGDHSYEGVRADLEAFFPKVKPGGLIIGDDYLLGKWWKDGVVRAFNEFLLSAPVLLHLKIGQQIMVRKLANA